MTIKEFDEYDLVIKNLENLRLSFNIEMQEIDEYAELGTNTYSRIISRKQPIRLDELISIGKNIYGLKGTQIFSSTLKTPPLANLPQAIRTIVKLRKGKAPRVQEKRDIIQYCVVILDKHFKVGDDFTNSQVKAHFKEELEIAFKRKSIEWSKSILSPFIEDTGETKPGKTKPEKVHKLVKRIPSGMVKTAKDVVGSDWLGD